MKKLFTFLFAIMASAIIAQAATYSGSLGKTINWSLNTSTGLLTITGSGSMEEVYLTESTYPWDDYYEYVKKVTIGEGITSIGTYAFYECENLASATLPSTLDSICNFGFANTKITSLTLPSNLHYLGSSVFYHCAALKTLNLSDALEVIPANMCIGCTSLQQITIPNSVTKIDSYAFEYCSSLSKVTLGSGIRTIRSSAFTETALEEDSKNWKNNVFYIGQACIRGGDDISGAVTIKDGTTLIAEDAFYTLNISSVSLPNSLLYINDYAFQSCPNLTSVSFGSSLLEIGVSAFEKASFTQVQLPDALQKIGEYAFSECAILASVSLGSSLDSIEENAFYSCPSLTSIVIPDNVKRVGDGAFEKCTALTDVTIGKSVNDIDMWIAFDSKYVKNLTFNAIHTKKVGAGIYEAMVLETITFGSEVEYIPVELCQYAENLTTVTLPSSLKEIDDYAFEGCKGLKKITIPNKVTKIGNYAFSDCTSMTTVTIGKAVTEIGQAAFDNAPIKTLKWNAKHCNSNISFEKVTSITFGSTVEYIPEYLCDEAVNLPSVIFPQSVKEIGRYAFYDCTALTELSLLENITKINDNAFANCENVKTVTCVSTTPPTLGSSVFNGIAEDATLRVPCGSLGTYKKKKWYNYFAKFEEYFPYEVIVKSEDESMGAAVLGDLNCTEGSVQIEAQPKTGFVFVGWSDGSTEALRTIQVTQDTTLVATFKVQTFLIQFVDWNGSLIQQADVEYNKLPDKPQEPVRKPTAQYTYTFKGWKPEVTVALEDAMYKANYDSVVNTYTITFLNEDNSTLSSKKWAYGETPYCKEPTKESSAEFVYHFNGWNPAIESVTGEATYKATFRAVPFHTLVFLDWNGDLIDVIKVEEGMPAATPADPKRTGFTFSGWSRDLSAVMENLYVIALYEPIPSGVEVIFMNPNDQILSKQSADLALPVIPDSEQPHFLGWMVESGNLTDGIVIRAQYDSTPTAVPAAADQSEPSTSKIFRNGTIYILRGDKIYTLTGQQIK